uniref:Mobilization protein n=1 Tax=Panagrellus redivivus TaxID=6233 RepID=A0A7E4V1Q4_PANRE
MAKSRRETQTAIRKPVNAARGTAQQRQMLRVQRSEPTDGVVRNELRFVSYQGKSGRLNAVQPETQIVTDAFAALLGRMSELGIQHDALLVNYENANRANAANHANNSQLAGENASLKEKLAQAEETISRLRRQIESARDQANIVVNTLSS